jgi:hypothetical protein
MQDDKPSSDTEKHPLVLASEKISQTLLAAGSIEAPPAPYDSKLRVTFVAGRQKIPHA